MLIITRRIISNQKRDLRRIPGMPSTSMPFVSGAVSTGWELSLHDWMALSVLVAL